MYDVHVCVHMCNSAPQRPPTPTPSSVLKCLNLGPSARCRGCQAELSCRSLGTTSGHAGGRGGRGGYEKAEGEGGEGRGEGAQAWVGASPIPSLPFQTPTPATLSSAHLSPQGDPARGPFSHSSWPPGRPGPGSSSPHPPSPLRLRRRGKRFPITLSGASATTSLSLSLGCLPTTRGGLTQPGGDRKALKPLTAALGPLPAAHPLEVRERVLAGGVPLGLRLGPGASRPPSVCS